MSQPVGTLRDERGQAFTLDAVETVIGRERSCAVCLPSGDARISRRHARIVRTAAGAYFIEDLGSTNGTLLNGQPLPAHQVIPLQPGNQLQIGQQRFVFQIEAAPPQAARAPSRANMVPRLRLHWPNGQTEAIFSGQPMTIGRGSDCDVTVPWKGLSRQHARVEVTPQGYAITDLKSTNRVWYQGKPVQSQFLRAGDTFFLGQEVQLQVDFVPAEGPAVGPSTHMFTPVSGKTVMTIGRAKDNDFVIAHPQISRQHAQLRRIGARLYLKDLDSTHGSYVNGQRIQKLTLINPGDEIRLAGQRVVITATASGQTVLGAVREGGNIRLDGMGLWKHVGSGRGQKVILQDISLSILPGEFVTLVGVSGAGKSTLLRALSGFDPATRGTIHYNGDDYYAHFDAYRNSVGYVPQREIIHMELPTRRALLYAARLRFPSDTSPREMEKRVNEVLKLLGIWDRRDVQVGSLSGGQQKRVSIAVELLTQPHLIFLDEPTSGLDPGYEKKMMEKLREMANEGQTVVLVTHNIQNIDLCDQIAFLSHGGRLAYYGPPDQICSYFEVNELADVYARLEGHPDRRQRTPSETGGDSTLNFYSKAWQDRFRRSPLYNEYVKNRLREARQKKPATPVARPAATAGNRASGLRQFFILCQRYLEIIGRDRRNLLLLLLQAPILAAIISQIYDKEILVNTTLQPPSPGDRAGAITLTFLFCIISIWLGTSNACREIVKELPIYLRERAVNLKLFPYVMSKVCVMALFSLFQSIALVGIILAVIDRPDIDNLFGKTLLTMFLASLTGATMGLLVSALSPNANRAITLVPLLLIPQVIFSGLMVPLDEMGPLGHLGQISICRPSFVALGTVFDLERIEIPGEPEAPGMPPGPPGPWKADQGPFDASVPAEWGHLLLLAAAFTGLTIYFQKKKDVRRRT